jgi:CelD/BcsL family acetyltransferase involved in cellulose biosynthesis
MQIEVIDKVDALQAFEPIWETLRSANPITDVFTSLDWFLNWWNHFGNGVEPNMLVVHDGDKWTHIPGYGARLHVLVVWDGDEPVAIAPLILVQGQWRRFPVRILAPPLNSHAPRSGFLVPREPHAAVAALVQYLVNSTLWDVMLLDGIPRQSGFVAAFREVAAQRLCLTPSTSSWSHLYLALEGNWEEYLSSRNRHFRKHLWQAERALAQLGTVTIERYDSPDTIQTGMQAFMEIDRESWKARDGESIALHPALGTYYQELAERFARRNCCELWLLSIANEPAAAFLCLRDARKLYTLKTAYKAKFASARYSPGIVLLTHIIQEAWKAKLLGVDFVGRMPFVER